jgi:hypothetical protein
VNKRVSVKAFEGFHVPDRLLSVLSTVRPIGGALTVLEPPRKLGFVIDQSAANVAVVPQSLENMVLLFFFFFFWGMSFFFFC